MVSAIAQLSVANQVSAWVHSERFRKFLQVEQKKVELGLRYDTKSKRSTALPGGGNQVELFVTWSNEEIQEEPFKLDEYPIVACDWTVQESHKHSKRSNATMHT